MSDKLKPCPFCGGEAYYWRGNLSGLYMVGCNNGSCRGYVMDDTKRISLENAVEAWNTRAERTFRYEHIEGTWYKTSCGKRYDGVVPPNYCPNCGGKVVS